MGWYVPVVSCVLQRSSCVFYVILAIFAVDVIIVSQRQVRDNGETNTRNTIRWHWQASQQAIGERF